MKKYLLLAWILMIITAFGAANAYADMISIDFDDLTAGTVVTDQYAAQGVTFGLVGAPSNYYQGPIAYALDPSQYNNVSQPLVLVPGDDVYDPFYDMQISFSTTIDYFSFYAIDADENLTISAYLGDDLVESAFYAKGTNTQEYFLELGFVGGDTVFDRVVLDLVNSRTGSNLGGPEYYDNLNFNTTGTTSPVPEPATLLLLGTGLVGLGAAGRKKTIRR